jgi:DNA polymerase-3 subunit delta
MKVRPVRDEGAAFMRALEKGFPQGHYLLITADVMDRRKKIYKELKKVAVLVNCTVSKGDRQADRSEQQKVLSDSIRKNLAEAGKTLDGDAFRQMIDLIGFDLRTFVNSVDKLIAYTGERARITRADVHALLRRTKKDPIYEISNAVADRRTEKVLVLIDDLLSEKNSHPLMILAMLINQVRRLLLVKAFLLEEKNGWRNGMSFNQFKTAVFPLVRSRDEKILAQLTAWQADFFSGEATSGRRRKKVKSNTTLVRGSGSPYPVYQLFLRAAKFSMEELRHAVVYLAEVDMRMKSSGGDPRMLLEKAVIDVLAGEGRSMVIERKSGV